MSTDEYPIPRRGTYPAPGNPETLIGEEEPEDLNSLPPYLVMDLHSGNDGTPDEEYNAEDDAGSDDDVGSEGNV